MCIILTAVTKAVKAAVTKVESNIVRRVSPCGVT